MKALEKKCLVLYLFPLATQLRKVVWRGIDKEGVSFLDRIPKQLMARPPNNTELYVELINGSIIQCCGTDNPDALRGMAASVAGWSETQNHHPRAFEIINPMIVQNKGTQIFNGTPMGKNHFYKMYQSFLKLPEAYVSRLTVDDTFDSMGNPIFSKKEIEFERSKGVSDESIRQEYYCDFNVGQQGAYYTHEMDMAEAENRICMFTYDPALPVFTAWDIGIKDTNSIWFFQQRGKYIDFINYIEGTDKGIDYWWAQVQDLSIKFGYRYKNHFGPHDLRHRKGGHSARSTLSLAADMGLHFIIVPNVLRAHGIQSVRAILPECRFHVEHCALGIDALRQYCREYDEVNKVFKPEPKHSWASNGADAFRYFAVYWSQNFSKPDPNRFPTYSLDSYDPMKYAIQE